MLSGLYKYHGASCGLCEEEAVSPLGRRQQQAQGEAVRELGGRDWGHPGPSPPFSPRQHWLLPSSPAGRARPACSTLDWLYFSISRKQRVGKAMGAFWESRQQEEGEHSGTDSKVLLGAVPALVWLRMMQEVAILERGFWGGCRGV